MLRRRHRLALALGVASATVLGLAGPAAAASDPGFGTITGHVTTASGGHPNFSLIILLTPSGNGVDETVASPKDGSFEFDNVSPGSYKVQFDSDGKVEYAHQKLTLADADLVPVAADQTTVVDEILLPPGAIAISASDAVTGQPVGHLCALAQGRTTAPEICISDPGVLTVPDLGAGDYLLTVRSTDGLHRRVQLSGVHVQLTQTTTVPISLTPTGAISATVTDSATGTPIGGACVAALRPGFNGPGPDSCPNLSDADGKVLVGELAAGTYNLFVGPRDSIHGLQWVGFHGGTGDQSAAVPIQVVPGDLSSAPTVRLDPAGSITGIILDPDGQPLAFGNATASVLPTGLPNDLFAGTINTDDQGRYTLDGLGPYRWPVQYLTGWDGTLAWQWSGDAGNRYEAHRVSVTAGQTATADFQLAAGGTLTGQILNPDGSLYTDPVDIWAYNAVTGDLTAPMTTAMFGTFTINALTTQDIKLQYSVEAFPNPIPGPGFDAATPIHVRLGAPTSYDLVLNR